MKDAFDQRPIGSISSKPAIQSQIRHALLLRPESLFPDTFHRYTSYIDGADPSMHSYARTKIGVNAL
jgi:hypothetical protein